LVEKQKLRAIYGVSEAQMKRYYETASNSMDVTDRLAIHEVVAQYSHMVDDKRWDDLGLVFSDDGVFDATDRGYPLAQGMTQLRAHMETAQHPLAHCITNVVLREIDADTVEAHSKMIAVRVGGVATTSDYYDLVVRTPDGWRIRRKGAKPPLDPGRLPRGTGHARPRRTGTGGRCSTACRASKTPS